MTRARRENQAPAALLVLALGTLGPVLAAARAGEEREGVELAGDVEVGRLILERVPAASGMSRAEFRR